MDTKISVEATKKFSSEWWGNFLAKSKNMSLPTVVKNSFTTEETSKMRQHILEILKDLANLRTAEYGYRVYKEDGTQLNKREMGAVYDKPPLSNETIEEWWKRVFGSKKMGIVLNDGERFNLELSKFIAKKIAPLLEKTGIPVDGVIFVLFLGNYESTPFGIHLDYPGNNVMHFHLGPGSKTIYTWDTTEYKEKVGAKGLNNNFDFDTLLPIATKNHFAEGDIFSMPEDTFHIGMQEGLSIGLSVWFYNRSKRDFAERLISLLLEHLKGTVEFTDRKIEYNLRPDSTPLGDSSFLETSGILDLFEFPEDFENLTFQETLKEIYIDLKYSLKSNAGYRSSPFQKEKNFDFKKEDTVRLEKPFLLQYKLSRDKEKLHIFVRGIKFEFNNFNCITKFIDKINEGEPIKVKKLLLLLEKDWNDDIGFYILNLLYKHNGIKVN